MPAIDISTAWLVFDAVLVVYWIGVSVLIVSEDREPTAALAWLLVLYALPFVGLALYFFFGRNWPAIVQKQRKTRDLQRIVSAFMPERYRPHTQEGLGPRLAADGGVAGRVSRLVERKAGAPPLPAHSVEIFADGAGYFDALLADLASAQRFVHLQYFIWGKDELTARITAVLQERLAAGVEVRILNDYLGCLGYDKDELRTLESAGAIVGHDVSGLARLNYRNHRKIAVIDGRVGHTGGFNIKQEYIDGGSRYPAWRDTGLRLTGPAVADLEKLFDMRWYEVFSEDLFDERYYPSWSSVEGARTVQTVHQGYDDPWNAVTRSYQAAISGARERVLVQSPYYVPDASTADVLINAAAAGVRVEFMTTAWPDKKVPWWAAESYFEPLLAAGARVWLWQPGFFHAKSLTVDDRLCAIGTLNLDMRSLRINKELMVWLYDSDLVAEHASIFEADRAECRELTLAEVAEWSRLRRVRNSACRLLSHLL